MSFPALEAIEKLRELRERSALVELESSNRARDIADARADRFEAHLQVRSDAVKNEQARIYGELIDRQITSNELDDIHARVESKNADLRDLAEKAGQAKVEAETAGEKAEAARFRHMRLFKAQQKWAALMNRESQRLDRAEAERDDLVIEDSFHPTRTRW
ncbi:hypothetical protein JDN40_03180 [Rhodomicrobium vannielii ATCC 17100]|uniref:hypothetical protein n=1 Tax=Rhodomicrobium vannielii TaxID=1069 RepID=UPI0019185372|nr:hypothetical protein [Rhodomicrobium vannielii]MBJ7533116.1 hypothetical protein [Rhodomicrobium vannielii ATCC 17100]